MRDGTLPAGSRLPSSRALAGDLGVSRRLVVDAYAQLLAEGYLVARQGAGTYVAATAGSRRPAPRRRRRRARRSSTSSRARPTSPRSRARCGCARLRDVLRSAPDGALAYPRRARRAGAAPRARAYLRRVRGVVADPDAIVVCAGATQGLALLGRALAARGATAIDVEDPGLPPHRAVLSYAGLQRRAARASTSTGVDVAALRAPRGARTPAHQCPTGVVLSPQRRGELVRWARDGRRS